MAWTDEMVDQLRAMWKEGLTTGEIGKRLGVSKNSIVGKVHRLGLSGRPSPIKKKDEAAPAEKKAAPQTKEKNKEQPTSQSTPKPTAKPEKKIEEEPTLKETPAPSFKKEENVHHHHGKTSLTDLDNHTCRWPLGDPKDENFHFCGKKVRIGQTYCDEHANIAYVKASKK